LSSIKHWNKGEEEKLKDLKDIGKNKTKNQNHQAPTPQNKTMLT
jgi:hypothetical protein